MNKSVFPSISIAGALLVGFAAAGGASAAEVGRVISSRQVIETVGVPRQVCSTEPMLLDVAPTGGGALAGAAVGGLAGNAIGSGGGRALATMIGFLAGSIVGDQIEARQPPRLFNVEHCSVRNFTENRTVGWDVEYEYAGRRYSARMPQDPGATIPLDVSPASAMPLAGAAPVVTAPRAGYAPPAAYSPYPSYPAASAYPVPSYPAPVYAPRPAYVAPPVSIGLGVTYIGGRRH